MRKNNVILIQLYKIFSWVCSFRITINNSDKIATRRYNVNKSNSKWKSYSNKNEKDNEVTMIVVKANSEYVKRLNSVEIMLIYHNEMKKLTMTMKYLIEKCVVKNEYKNKVYKVYLNNQTSLKIIRLMKLNNDKTRLRRIQKVCETIRSRDANLKFRWISKYKKIQSNEDANIATKNVYRLSMSLETRRKIIVITMLIRIKIKWKWKL